MTRTANGTPPPLPDDVLTSDGGIVTIRPARADDQAGFAPQSPLRRVLAPRAVAVVGADRRHGGAGHEALRALRDYGFRGHLYAVGRSGRPVCGVPAYRTVADLPRPVDLLVVAVPADQVVRVLTDAGPLGVRGAVLLGTGPGGTDPVAERGRREILRAARENGIRLLGPACLGILNTDPAVRLNATLSPARPPSGGLALAVRSGAVGIALLADAVREHCGVSTLVSLGDETDITGSDLLAHWFDDPATRAVALSPEAFADPGRFARAARALGRRKPVLAIASAQPHAPGEDLLAGAGVIRTASLGETIDTARMLVDQPLPDGNRLGLVGNAGGLTALAADTARGYGFDVIPLGDPAHTGAERDHNPVDLGCDALPAQIADAAEMVASSGEADMLLLVLVGTRATVLAATLSALGPVLDDYPSLPVAAVVTGGAGEFHQLGRRGAPVFREPAQAVQALAHARDYAAWRRQPLARRPEPVGLHAGTERASIRRALSARPGRIDRRFTADVLAGQIVVVDADLGVSGRFGSERNGYRQIVARLWMGEVGAVFGLEVSRLGRSNAELTRLMELARLTDTLLIDTYGVYDLADVNDRILLARKGQMSETKLYFPLGRLPGAKLAAAHRGELRDPLAVECLCDEDGLIVKDPDEQVHGAVADLFAEFHRTGSALRDVVPLASAWTGLLNAAVSGWQTPRRGGGVGVSLKCRSWLVWR